MTDRSNPTHPDVETLSDWLDGGAPAAEERAHLDQCAPCQDRLAELRAARDAVAQPVAPLGHAQREQAISRALAASAEWGREEAPARPVVAAPGPSAPAGRGGATHPPPRVRWWLGGSAAAAVLVLVVATVALLGQGTRVGDDTALSAGPAESGKEADARSFAGTGDTAGSGETAVHGGDLGDIPSIDVLRARVATATPVSGRTLAEPAPGVPSVPGAPSGAGGAVTSDAPVASVVGTRVCEVEARELRPQLAVIVYAANLRFQGTGAVVLGFAPTPGVPPVTLLVLAPQEGCRLLAESGPS